MSNDFKKSMLNKLINFMIDFEEDLIKNGIMPTMKQCISYMIDDEDCTGALYSLNTLLDYYFESDDNIIIKSRPIMDYYRNEIISIKNTDVTKKILQIAEKNPLNNIIVSSQNYQESGTLPNDADILLKEYKELLKLVKLFREFISINYGEDNV